MNSNHDLAVDGDAPHLDSDSMFSLTDGDIARVLAKTETEAYLNLCRAPTLTDEGQALLDRIKAKGPPALATTQTIPRALPEFLGKYRLCQCLGQGANGTVWKAHDIEADCEFALKFARSGNREFGVAAQFAHPNVVTAFGVEKIDGFEFIVMDFVNGFPLRAERLAPREAAQHALQIARGLVEIHRRGIVHGDLKPANIMVDRSTQLLRITDFGVAQFLNKTSFKGGTPAYMSPEHSAPGGRLDERSDIFSLGIILCELLTGIRPSVTEQFMRTHESTGSDKWLSSFTASFNSQSAKLLPGAEPKLHIIAKKCAMLDPADRFQSAQEVVDELERFLDDRPIKSKPAGWLERNLLWVRREPLAAGLVAIVGLLTAGLLLTFGVSYYRISQERDAAAAARDQAMQNFEDARQLMGGFVTALAPRLLAHQPGTAGVRREILERVLPYYENFYKRYEGNSQLRGEVAEAHLSVAYINWRIGNNEEAKHHYRKAEQLASQLFELSTDERTTRILIRFLSERCVFAKSLGLDFDPVESLAEAEELARRLPLSPEGQNLLALVLSSRGDYHLERREFQHAEQFYVDALAIWTKLPVEKAQVQHCIATAHFNLGYVARDNNRSQAIEHYQAAIAHWQRLDTNHHLSVECDNGLGHAYYAVGRDRLKFGDIADACDLLEDSYSRFKRLADENPMIANHVSNLSATRQVLMEAHHRAEKLTSEQLGEFDRAAHHLEARMKLDSAAKKSTSHHCRIARYWAKGAFHVKATAKATEILQTRHPKEEDYYNLTCVYALAAKAANNDPGLDRGQQMALANEYAAEAARLFNSPQTAKHIQDTQQPWRTDEDLKWVIERGFIDG